MGNLTSITFDPQFYERLCKNCFMTGRECIHLSRIRKALKEPKKAGTRSGQAFVLMPFRSTFDELYYAQLKPCFESVVYESSRADQVSRTGYVMCERICSQIQQSHLICAELSTDNANVFYELGLAYAIQRNIALFIQQETAPSREAVRNKLGIGDALNLYKPFDLLHSTGVRLWAQAHDEKAPATSGGPAVVILGDRTRYTEEVNGHALEYSVDRLCRGAISRALDDAKGGQLPHDKELIVIEADKYRGPTSDMSFADVEKAVRASSLVVVCTASDEPCSYFWLGFSHGLEKDVVPITVEKREEKGIKLVAPAQTTHVDEGLAFDVRALWHIFFPLTNPGQLQPQMKSVLAAIGGRDGGMRWRRQLWKPFLDHASVSVFVGSVELTPKQRHVVGEWDYRTVAELTGFLRSAKETLDSVIETPTYQASLNLATDKPSLGAYRDGLRGSLQRAAIIIASADVNDMTEMALATHSGLQAFEPELRQATTFNGIVAFKGVAGDKESRSTPSIYFAARPEEVHRNQRGFYVSHEGGAPSTVYSTPYVGWNQRSEQGYSKYFAHVAIMRMPNTGHPVVVIQGITGPATFGAAQALTGLFNKRFTVFDGSLDVRDQERVGAALSALRKNVNDEPETELARKSEELAEALASTFARHGSAEVILAVYLLDGLAQHHDERRLIWWDVVRPAAERLVPNRLNP